MQCVAGILVEQPLRPTSSDELVASQGLHFEMFGRSFIAASYDGPIFLSYVGFPAYWVQVL